MVYNQINNQQYNRIANKVKAAFLSIDFEGKLFMFGSHARGDFNAESDWDFLLLTKKNINLSLKKSVIDNIVAVELEENICVQILLKNDVEWEERYSVTPIYKNIKEEGVEI